MLLRLVLLWCRPVGSVGGRLCLSRAVGPAPLTGLFPDKAPLRTCLRVECISSCDGEFDVARGEREEEGDRDAEGVSGLNWFASCDEEFGILCSESGGGGRPAGFRRSSGFAQRLD